MRNSWRFTMTLFALTGVIESLAFGHLGAFTPLYLQQLHVPDNAIRTWTGVLGSIGFVLGFPLLPFWAVWADRYGRKLIIIRSAYVEAVLFVIAALSVNVWMLAAARFLSGFVLGNTGVMLAAQSENTPHNRLGTAVAFIGAGPILGQALGPAFGGQFIERFGIRSLLGFDAALTVAIALVLTVFLHEQRTRYAGTETVWSSIGAAGRNIIEQPLVVRLFILNFLVAMGVTMMGPYLPLRIEELFRGVHSNLPGTIGTTLTFAGIAMAVTTPLWGRLGDRFGFLWIMRMAAFGLVVSMIGQAASASLPALRDWRVVQGCVQGGVDATLVALIAVGVPAERRSAILNFARLPAQFAWFLGPLVGALVAQSSTRAVFAVAAIFTLLALAMAYAVHLPVESSPVLASAPDVESPVAGLQQSGH
ncbi:MAG: MFS transporter [Herpetosiphon sp.]